MIYFIQCGTNGPIKIGYTDNDVQARMAQLQTGCPYELRLLWVYNGEDYTEAQVHSELSHERVRGEWFHPTREVFGFIESEMGNQFEIKTKNGRSLSLIESYDCEDEITLNTKDKDVGGRRFTTIFNKFNRNEIYIDPTDEQTFVAVNRHTS